MTADLVAALGAHDSCTLSDALDSLGLAGCVTGLIATLPGVRVAGRVHTVKLAAGKPPAGAPVRHLGAAAIDAAAAGEVIVVEQATGIEAGSWGGLLSRAARARDVAAVIAEGLVRDVDEAREIGFPIFCRGYTAFTARGRVHEEASDVPVTIGGVTVAPGAIVVADSSAAVFVAPGDAAAVIEAAARIAGREAEIVRRVEAGEAASAAMGANYEHMLNKGH